MHFAPRRLGRAEHIRWPSSTRMIGNWQFGHNVELSSKAHVFRRFVSQKVGLVNIEFAGYRR